MSDDVGLLDTGYVPDTTPSINAKIGALVKSNFGASLLKPKTFLNFLVGIIAEQLGLLHEDLEVVYSAQDPDKAVRSALEVLALLTGTTKPTSLPSTVTETLCGNDGFVVPSGSIVSVVSTGKRFTTSSSATIAALPTWAATSTYVVGDRASNSSRCYACIIAGTSGATGPITTADDITDGTVHWQYLGEGLAAVDVAMTSVDLDAVVAVKGDLTSIETPVGGWNTARNVKDAVLGRPDITDEDFRLLREAQLHSGGKTPSDAIRAALLRITGVTNASVFMNLGDVADANGLPPHSVESLVRGGSDQAVFDALWANVAGGIVTYGTTVGTVVDSEGTTQTLKFSRPTPVPIYVDVTLVKDPRFYPADGDAQARADVAAYGNTGQTGKDAVASSLGAQALSVTGVLDVTRSLVYTDVIGTPVAWAPTTAYVATVGSRSIVTNDGGRVYICIIGGTSAASGGPTGVETDITDGGAHWRFLGATIAVGLRELATYATSRIAIHSSDGVP